MTEKNKSSSASEWGCAILIVFGFMAIVVNAPGNKNRHSNNSSQSLKWYQGGTLHRATLGAWTQSTYRNRLATSSDFIVAMMKTEGESPRDMNDLKRRASVLERCISEVAIEKRLHNLEVSEVAAASWILMNSETQKE